VLCSAAGKTASHGTADKRERGLEEEAIARERVKLTSIRVSKRDMKDETRINCTAKTIDVIAVARQTLKTH
jgi:putative NADH-flavin reductase